MTTMIYGDRTTDRVDAEERDGELWLRAEALASATGWEVKPEGMCAGDVCVVAGRSREWLEGDRFNHSAFARHLGQAVRPRRRGVGLR